uniref:Ubiquitin carboxyl-terminal hydrolase 36 n=1 Tax=Ditylenchus dipsaci TaxID=166011 RepID=A0A915EL01_9BILA
MSVSFSLQCNNQFAASIKRRPLQCGPSSMSSTLSAEVSLLASPFRSKNISFTYVGILESSSPESTHLVLDEEENEDRSKSPDAVNATSSGASCNSNSTPASSNCTPNSITTELTSVPEPDDLEEERKVRKIMAKERVEGCEAAAEANGTVKKRARLLSERGERELEFPVIDQQTSKSGWHGCSHLRNKHGLGCLTTPTTVFSIVFSKPLCIHLLLPGRVKQTMCITCGLRTHVLKAISEARPFEALWIQKFLTKIFPAHRRGYQEDAHEMLTLLLGALEPPISKANGAMKIQPTSSSPIEQIFGGSLRNQIRCNTCGTIHTNYERIREINLGLNRSARTSITELLNDFFRQEQLAQFFCKSCKMKRTATRSTWLLRAPSNLIIQLKRFNLFGGKNRLPVKADVSLNLSKYLFNEEPSLGQYTLNGIIEHIGSGVNFGHYVSSWRGFNEQTFTASMIQT